MLRRNTIKGFTFRPIRAYFVLINALGMDLMPLDTTTLVETLVAGGYIAADATVKEMTKDAYQAFKRAVGVAFGRRAETAADRLEAEETRDAAKAELVEHIREVRDDEAADIMPSLQAFLDAMRADQNARTKLEHARIGLDLDVAGNVLLEDIQGAREIGVKAKAGQDFTLKGVRMDPGGRSGN